MKKNNIIKIALLLIVALFLFSLIHRIPNIDDAWLGEHAYWMAKLGYVKSELMRGITQQEVRVLWYHRILTWQGALFIKLFGFSVYTLKLPALLYLIAFLVIYYLNFYKKIFTSSEFYLSLLILISNAWIFEYSFVFRPELILMTLGFLSYLSLDKVLKNDKRSILYTIIGGLIAGLCVLTHLNGVIFPIAGFLLLLWNRKFVLSIIFGLSTIPTLAFYFYGFTSTSDLNFWYHQLNETPAHDRISSLPFGLYYIQNLINEHLRFFHSPVEVSFSVLFVSVFVLAYKKLAEYKNLIRYTGLLIIFLGVFSVHKASYYMILYLPYLIILIILSLRIILNNYLSTNSSLKIGFNKRALYFSSVLLIAYLLVNVFYDIKLSRTKYNHKENREIVDKYIKEKTDSCRIVASMTFMFDEILRFKSIQSDMCYTEMQKSNKNIYKEGFLQLTKKFDIDYIILSKGIIEKLGVDKLTNEDFTRNGCEVLLKSDSLVIIKNIKPELKTDLLLN